MIQLIVNVNLLREIDERKLINAYARYMYNSDEDTSDDNKIKSNLIKLLDWDINGDNGLGIYCSKFEGIKKRDWVKLIQFIKENHYEIKLLSYTPIRHRKLQSIKEIRDVIEKKKQHQIERFTDPNYKHNNSGKPAKTCIYNGKTYSSRQECMYKEGITQNQLYRYLEKTGQV